VAYRVLGSVTEAEDTLQEAWLRWSGVEHSEVADPRAFLVRVSTRLAIDRLRRAKARRESYVGPWLPEPILTRQDPAEDVALPNPSRWPCLWCWRRSRRLRGPCSS
jgi:RNA polymerase sigma-70 factor, ECF subfamily